MEWVERRWEGSPGAMGGRKARASFTYRAFVPDRIASLQPSVTFELADVIDAADTAVRQLNADQRVRGLEAIGALLLRSEAIASSRIEGIQLTQRNLARALIDPRAARGAAQTVAANVVAMEQAIAIGESEARLAVGHVLEIHRTLMEHEHDRTSPGAFRREQNWIGGRLTNPSDARYIPPPEDLVEPLMDDLMAFMNREDLPAVAQAAIAHAQFETIHPFIDGNGRVGRCLIHVLLRRRRVAPIFVPPVSIVLAARPRQYVEGLTGFREGKVNEWCDSFAAACTKAAWLSVELAEQVAQLESEWYERAGRPRRDSAAARIIRHLPAQPITSAATIRAAIGARHQRALEGLELLAQRGVVRQISEGRYDKQYAADELFDLIENYEGRLAAA